MSHRIPGKPSRLGHRFLEPGLPSLVTLVNARASGRPHGSLQKYFASSSHRLCSPPPTWLGTGAPLTPTLTVPTSQVPPGRPASSRLGRGSGACLQELVGVPAGVPTPPSHPTPSISCELHQGLVLGGSETACPGNHDWISQTVCLMMSASDVFILSSVTQNEPRDLGALAPRF